MNIDIQTKRTVGVIPILIVVIIDLLYHLQNGTYFFPNWIGWTFVLIWTFWAIVPNKWFYVNSFKYKKELEGEK